MRKILLALAFVAGCSGPPAEEPIDYVALSEAVQQSQNYALHGQTFEGAAVRLVEEGRCTVGDLASIGGFIRSDMEFPDEPVYFTYCGLTSGERATASKVYLNVQTGVIT